MEKQEGPSGNRDEVLKALEKSGLSSVEAEAVVRLSERMKGVMPQPKTQSYEEAVTALHDGIEHGKNLGMFAKNPITAATRKKVVGVLKHVVGELAIMGVYDLIVHNWAHLQNFFNDAGPDTEAQRKAGVIYDNANRASKFGSEIAAIPWAEKRRLASFAGSLIAHELRSALGGDIDESYLKIYSEQIVAPKLFAGALEGQIS